MELYSKLNVLKVRLEMAFKRRCGEIITRSSLSKCCFVAAADMLLSGPIKLNVSNDAR